MYKDEFDLSTRQTNFALMMAKYPAGIPIICEPARGSRDNFLGVRREFSINRSKTLAHLLRRIRRDAKISETEGLFVMVDGILQPCSTEIGMLYDWQKDQEDGWLYVTYYKENTFGAEWEGEGEQRGEVERGKEGAVVL